MDDKKFCFIMCANQKELADECLLYIEQLHVPDGFSVETKVIYNAKSMASGYNRAMRESDAKYKIYLHQDVLLIYRDILSKILEIFTAHQKIGLLGVVGNSSLEEDGCPWSGETERRIGGLRVDVVTHKENVVFAPVIGAYQAAVVLDGLFLATQYDVPWREDLFQGWDFYDCSQSLEFWRAGYQVVVPHMETPWCLHDNDIQNMEHYEQWRCIFEKEYAEDYLNWVDGKFIQRPKIIYQKFTGKNPAQPVPYPPIYREKEVQYICFTDNAQVTSKTWDIRYVKNLDELKIETELPKNSRTFELFENQIQIGAVFEKNEEYTSVITVPSFSELPYMIFEPDKIVPTADENGRYKHRRNPVYTGGAYGGRSLLLTIGVPVSNQIDTIERCLSHMKPLLDELDSELLVIDTGSTDGTLDICRRYGARIVSLSVV